MRLSDIHGFRLDVACPTGSCFTREIQHLHTTAADWDSEDARLVVECSVIWRRGSVADCGTSVGGGYEQGG